MKIFRSFAYKRSTLQFRSGILSFLKFRNIEGPKTYPWGTSEVTSNSSNCTTRCSTINDLSMRFDWKTLLWSLWIQHYSPLLAECRGPIDRMLKKIFSYCSIDRSKSFTLNSERSRSYVQGKSSTFDRQPWILPVPSVAFDIHQWLSGSAWNELILVT